MDKDKEQHRHSDYRNPKQEQLDEYRHQNTGPGKKMTDENGKKISNDEQTLRAGRRGPTLLQDFHFYKKQTHFNRERIPKKLFTPGDLALMVNLKHTSH